MNELWIAMFLSNLLIPVLMLVFGLWFYKNPPKKISSYFGYRTLRSMKNIHTWTFAHQFFGKILLRNGIISLIITLMVMFLILHETNENITLYGTILTMILVVFMILPIIPTEKELKKTFDDEGKPFNRRKVIDEDYEL